MKYFPVDSQQLVNFRFASCRLAVPQSVSRRNDGFPYPNIAQHSGYTLIEMIISVGLIVVLMTVVGGLMSTYAMLQTAGTEATAEQQLVRSIMQLIRNDLEAVSLSVTETSPQFMDPFAAFDDVEAVPGPDSHRRRKHSVRSVFDIKDLQRNQHAGPANISIRGTADVIRITIPCTPVAARHFNDTDQFSGADGMAPSVGEFQTIVYQFQRSGSTDNGDLPLGLYRIQTDAARLQLMPVRRSGMVDNRVRSELRVDRDIIEELLFSPPGVRRDQAGSLGTESSCDLIPDIVGCRFNYFDGHTWHQNWAAGRDSLLPVAIRTTLEIVSMRELRTILITEEPPGRLEQRLRWTFARTETPANRSGSQKLLREPRIAPRSYSSLILLDTTTAAGTTSLYAVGGGA